MSVYVIVATVTKRLTPQISLHETLQLLSLTMFETTRIDLLLRFASLEEIATISSNQLNLFTG